MALAKKVSVIRRIGWYCFWLVLAFGLFVVLPFVFVWTIVSLTKIGFVALIVLIPLWILEHFPSLQKEVSRQASSLFVEVDCSQKPRRAIEIVGIVILCLTPFWTAGYWTAYKASVKCYMGKSYVGRHFNNGKMEAYPIYFGAWPNRRSSEHQMWWRFFLPAHTIDLRLRPLYWNGYGWKI